MNRRNYLDILTQQIRCRRARLMIEEEIETHIDEQKLDFMAEGMSEAEAEEAAVREMGDPVDVGVQLDRIHRPRMEWRLLAAAAGLSLLGLILQIVVCRSMEMTGTVGVMFTTGYVVQKMFLWMAAGAAVMLGVCFMDYTVLGKYILWIWAADLAGMFASSFFTARINGSRPQMDIFICLMVPIFAGIIYHYRGKGNRGLWMCLLLLVVTFGGKMILDTAHFLVTVLSFGTIVLTLFEAVRRGWFGSRKKVQSIKAAGVMVIIPLAVFLMNLKPYQAARLENWMHPSEQSVYHLIDSFLVNLSDAQSMGNGTPAESWGGIIRSDYLWLFAVKYIGIWTGIVMAVLMAGFFFLLFRLMKRQKNQLGSIVGTSCTVMLFLETVIYIAMNCGYVPPGSLSMPFFSYGGSNMMITGIYLGIILSVCRNRNVVPAR